MFQRFFVVGVVGIIGLASGCSSCPSCTVQKSPGSTAEEAPQAAFQLTSATEPDKTKQVRIAVTGMT